MSIPHARGWSATAGTAAVPAATAAGSWICSAPFDLSLFVLSPLLALPLLIVSPHSSRLSIICACVLGIPHYLSTFTFYFWQDTREVHRAHWIAFFVVPVLLIASVWVGVLIRIPAVVQAVVFGWNVYHVARQSCGILSIYRHRAGATDPSIRPVANGAIIWVAVMMAFWNTEGFPALHGLLTAIWPRLPVAIPMVAGAIAFWYLARLVMSLARRFASADSPRAPELLFLATSLLLFHPYLWIRDSNMATLGMLIGHFIQYLGILWFVHRRRFTDGARAGDSPWLAALSRRLPLLLVVLLGTGVVSLFMRVGPIVPLRGIYAGLLLGVTLVHFYLDGLFWAFKRPEVRRSLAPHLFAARR